MSSMDSKLHAGYIPFWTAKQILSEYEWDTQHDQFTVKVRVHTYADVTHTVSAECLLLYTDRQYAYITLS
jgi:hypothetical protein